MSISPPLSPSDDPDNFSLMPIINEDHLDLYLTRLHPDLWNDRIELLRNINSSRWDETFNITTLTDKFLALKIRELKERFTRNN